MRDPQSDESFPDPSKADVDELQLEVKWQHAEGPAAENSMLVKVHVADNVEAVRTKDFFFKRTCPGGTDGLQILQMSVPTASVQLAVELPLVLTSHYVLEMFVYLGFSSGLFFLLFEAP